MDEVPPPESPSTGDPFDDHCPESVSRLWPLVVGESLPSPMAEHVTHCPRCQARIENLRHDVASLRESLWEGQVGPARISDPPPQKIGDYLILSVLGSGGQATVYRAWHPRLRIDVVVKWFRSSSPWIVDPDRLATEAALLGSIRHPYLGRVFDVSVAEGRPFLVMEYVRGKTFAQWVRNEQPSPARLALLLAKAAEAVHEVHRFGALHLDLKPQNILVDEQGDPRVIDFGMARLAERRSGSGPQWIAETPEYMSPEQCIGDAELISTRSDVYGLGAVLYWGIAERPPRTVHDLGTNPPIRGLASAPWGLRMICQQALSIRPRDRYPTGQEMADALRRFVGFQRIKYRLAACLLGVIGFVSLLAGIGGSRLWHTRAQVEMHYSVSQVAASFEATIPVRLRSSGIFPQRAMTLVATAYSPTFHSAPVAASVGLCSEDGLASCQQTDFRITADSGAQLYVACLPRECADINTDQLSTLLRSMEDCTGTENLIIDINRYRAEQVLTPPGWISRELDPEVQTLITDIQTSLSDALTDFHAVLIAHPMTYEDDSDTPGEWDAQHRAPRPELLVISK